jgi:hypothetical protein
MKPGEWLHPFLPQTINELLPTEDKTSSASLFLAVGPALVDALSNGEDFIETCNRLRLQTDDAFRILSSKEFKSYVEAYLSLGDITDKHVRIRFVKALLAVQVANGVTSRKREPIDFVEHIRKELSTSEKSTSINVQVVNTSVPRPYTRKETPILTESTSPLIDTDITD